MEGRPQRFSDLGVGIVEVLFGPFFLWAQRLTVKGDSTTCHAMHSLLTLKFVGIRGKGPAETGLMSCLDVAQ